MQGILANFDIQREFSAPPGYNIFGYSDDPLVCNDGPEVSANICTDFKGTVHGDVEYASLYVPILKNGRSRSWLSTSCSYRRNCL